VMSATAISVFMIHSFLVASARIRWLPPLGGRSLQAAGLSR
jgi:hypothetical protein